MPMSASQEDVQHLVKTLNFAEKVDRSLRLIEQAYDEYGDRLVVANSLGKDSCAVWHLAGRVSDRIRGFIVTTRFKPEGTRQFMREELERQPGRLKVFESSAEIPDELYKTDPDRCCEVLKVEPTRCALEELNAACWITGLRCTEGRTRSDYQEIEERDEGLIKLNPILLWYEREVWQYLALNRVPVNPLYSAGYRSLGCEPCSRIATGRDERAGRWIGTSKCGGECGIHTRSLKSDGG
jgi:phosphoadenylyl-sulfate reductase (thioredoxin)